MSGGSYDNLYGRGDADRIVDWGYINGVKEMARDAREDGYEDMADAMIKWAEEVKVVRKELQARHMKFEEFMKAYEFWKSGDVGKNLVNVMFDAFFS